MTVQYTHAGTILKEEFLEPLGLSQYKLAERIGVPRSRINDVCNAKRRLEVDLAIRLSRFFGNSAQFWLNLQNEYDLRQLQGSGTYRSIQQFEAAA